MKYERITEHHDRPLTMSMWAGDSKSLEVYNRLAEIEDKIERGELVERVERKGLSYWEQKALTEAIEEWCADHDVPIFIFNIVAFLSKAEFLDAAAIREFLIVRATKK